MFNLTRYVIFARVHIGPPLNRWVETTAVTLGTEAALLDDLMAGQIEGTVDRIESYDIGDLARDVSGDIAGALAVRVRERMAEDGYAPRSDLRDFIDTHAAGALPVHAFEPARVREDA